MSFSLDFIKIQLIIALGGGVFLHVNMKKHLPDSGCERRIIEIFASGDHFPLYFLSKHPGFYDFCLRRCLTAFALRLWDVFSC